jgi:hypothetical protein
MARLARVVAVDVPHHVTQRGNRREPKALQAKNGDQALGKIVTTGAIAVGTIAVGAPEASATSTLSDSALVVRGGVPTAAQLTKGAESITADGTLQGVSVQSADGATVEQLSQGIPNNQIGVTTVGDR